MTGMTIITTEIQNAIGKPASHNPPVSGTLQKEGFLFIDTAIVMLPDNHDISFTYLTKSPKIVSSIPCIITSNYLFQKFS